MATDPRPGADAPVKHSVRISGHATSISLEPVFWDLLAELASARGTSINWLVSEIDERHTGNLSSAIRVFIVERLRQKAD